MGDPTEMEPERITRRLMRLNMVANHTTSATITNVLLDLYGSPRVDEFVAGLREECQRVLALNNGQWSKSAVNDLHRVDSTIKESMRVSNIGLTGVMRKVYIPATIISTIGTFISTITIIIYHHQHHHHHRNHHITIIIITIIIVITITITIIITIIIIIIIIIII
jgi:cytochrome P450